MVEGMIRIVRTLVEHSTLNGTEKQELLGILDALDGAPAEETPAPAEGS